jgi:putative hydrolase of the HAD superfamily
VSTPHLICFDIGRVLVRICGTWAEAQARAGVGGPALRTDDAAVRAAIAEHTHAFEVGRGTLDDYTAGVGRSLARSPRDVAAMLDAWILGATRGAVELLDEVGRAGHTTACLSNTNARHWALMAAWSSEADRIFPRLALRFGSQELGVRKPDPAIYAAVEERSGFPPGRIVFFDDLLENVSAAQARGWCAVHVDLLDDPVSQMRAWLRDRKLL